MPEDAEIHDCIIVGASFAGLSCAIALAGRGFRVRVHAPNLRSVRLESPGYYFLATDTPGVMRWLAARAKAAGAEIAFRSAFTTARLLRGGWDLAFDHLQCDWMFNVLLSTPLMRRCARRIYFHR